LAEESQPPAQPAAEQPVVTAGSYVLLDYTLKVKETGELVDTTSEVAARDNGAFDPSKVYESRLVVPGKGMVLRAIEDELIGLPESGSKSFEIPPEKGFGQRDASKVRTIPLRRFRDTDAPLRVGSRVNVDGRDGIIRTIGSGRVQVDFNPYLAGKVLVCDVTVKKILTDNHEKAKAIIHNRIHEVDVSKFGLAIEGPVVRVTIPDEALLLPGLQVNKRVIARELREAISGVEKVVYVEEYGETPTQTPKQEEVAEAKA